MSICNSNELKPGKYEKSKNVKYLMHPIRASKKNFKRTSRTFHIYIQEINVTSKTKNIEQKSLEKSYLPIEIFHSIESFENDETMETGKVMVPRQNGNPVKSCIGKGQG